MAPTVSLVRVSGRSGRIRVIAEDRSDVVVNGAPHDSGDGIVTVDVGDGRAEIRVPAGTDLVVGTESGRVSVVGEAGAVSVSTASGRVTIESAVSIDVRAQSAAVEIGTSTGRCRVNTQSGRLRIGRTTDLEVHTRSGRVDVDAADGTIDARTTSGRVEVGLVGPSNVVAETVSGRVSLVVGAGMGATVDVETGGRVVNRAPAGDDCVITARSVSGRIEVRAR